MMRSFNGPDNAKPNNVIARRLGYTDFGTNGRQGIASSRSFTELVERMQRAGYPITRNSDGYFYANNPEHFDFEIHDCESRLSSWGRKLSAAKHARECLQPVLV